MAIDYQELYGDDPSIHQNEQGDWVHVPGHPVAKAVFLACSLAILLLGSWLTWEPLSRWILGEQETARVVRITRSEPGSPDKIIRFRQNIPEGNHETEFRYDVRVQNAEGQPVEKEVGIGSRRNAYANINDKFEVIYFPEDSYVYGLYHHRTWAFGISVLFVGVLLTTCALPTMLAVGKPIVIDPEAEKQTEDHSEEREA